MDDTLKTIEALQATIDQTAKSVHGLRRELEQARAEEITHLVVQLDDGLYLGQARNIVKRIVDEERSKPTQYGLDQRLSGGAWNFLQNFENLLMWYWQEHKEGRV